MIAGGYLVGDGSWELNIFVTDLEVDRVIRVKGDLHIGGVMLKLVEDLDVANDWSDHALWWPEKNMWLSRTRSTLDQYGVQADAVLHFTPMHKILRIQLPDLRFVDAKVDFSVKTFSSVINLTKNLGIRHPEELSLCRPLMPDHLKKNYRAIGCSPRQRGKDSALSGDLVNLSSDSRMSTPDHMIYTSPLPSPPTSPWNANQSYSSCMSYNGSSSPYPGYTLDSSFSEDAPLAHTPPTPSEESRHTLLRPKTLVERARLNCGWLDSSLSLMEQDVRQFDTLLLRYKFYSFFDLNPKFDAVRINQIYEQAKWSILTEEIDCTEEEMMMFAALQFQVNLQSQVPQSDVYSSNDDDIDAALTDLQVTLEGTAIQSNSPDITHVPELSGYLRFMKPRKFTLKSFKRYYFTFKDTQLCVFKKQEDAAEQPSLVINLKGSEITPDVNISQMKYGIKLEVPSHEGMTDYWVRCEDEEKYARWMAAFRLAAKGRTMADSSYNAEVKSILEFLSMQRPAPAPVINPLQVDISPEFFIAPRFLRKIKGKQVVQRILEAHTNVKDLSLIDSKLNFIKAWQALPEYGISLFVVKFMGSKREELLGVAFNRIMRMDLSSGDHIKTWRYNTMKAWNVNWEVRQMMVQFEEENIAFSCLSADCKVVHEYIGGYIFLSMRSKDQNQTLNEELFHKLTGGWS